MHITDFISDKMNSDDSKLLEELYSSEYQNLINYAGYILYNSDYVPNKALLAKRILLCSLFAGKETG